MPIKKYFVSKKAKEFFETGNANFLLSWIRAGAKENGEEFTPVQEEMFFSPMAIIHDEDSREKVIELIQKGHRACDKGFEIFVESMKRGGGDKRGNILTWPNCIQGASDYWYGKADINNPEVFLTLQKKMMEEVPLFFAILENWSNKGGGYQKMQKAVSGAGCMGILLFLSFFAAGAVYAFERYF